MNESEILDTYKDLFENLESYVVVDNNDESKALKFTILNYRTNAFVLIEDNSDEVAELLIKKGARKFKNIDEAKNPSSKSYGLKWDEQNKCWIKVNYRDL